LTRASVSDSCVVDSQGSLLCFFFFWSDNQVYPR
jgi:hypothetical protein